MKDSLDIYSENDIFLSLTGSHHMKCSAIVLTQMLFGEGKKLHFFYSNFSVIFKSLQDHTLGL